jgi:hypothetical protein
MDDVNFCSYVRDCTTEIEFVLKKRYGDKLQNTKGLGNIVYKLEDDLPKSLFNKLLRPIVQIRNITQHQRRAVLNHEISQSARFQFAQESEYCMKELGISFDENFFSYINEKGNSNNQPKPEQYQFRKYNRQKYFSYYDGRYDQVSKQKKEELKKRINNRMAFGIPGLVEKLITKYRNIQR